MLTILGAVAIVLAIALTAVSLTSILRALTPIGKLADRGVKPWSCNICMAAWSGLVAVAAAIGHLHDWRITLLLPPSHGLAVLLLVRLNPPPVLKLEE